MLGGTSGYLSALRAVVAGTSWFRAALVASGFTSLNGTWPIFRGTDLEVLDPIFPLIQVFHLFGQLLTKFAALVAEHYFHRFPDAETDTLVGVLDATQKLAPTQALNIVIGIRHSVVEVVYEAPSASAISSGAEAPIET